jgi:hypothetical protein
VNADVRELAFVHGCAGAGNTTVVSLWQLAAAGYLNVRPKAMLRTFVIEDDLSAQELRAVEVTLHFTDGSRRWCYFMNPAAFAECGDWIQGTKIRIHFGAPHMIVVANRLSQEVITRALEHIEREGKLEKCSLPFE